MHAKTQNQDLHKDVDDFSYRSTVWNTQGALLGPTTYPQPGVTLLCFCSLAVQPPSFSLPAYSEPLLRDRTGGREEAHT